MNTQTLDEPTRQQLQTEGILVAQRAKWDGWNWKEYQTSIVRQNHALSKLAAQRDELLSACKLALDKLETFQPEIKTPVTQKILRAAIAKAESNQT